MTFDTQNVIAILIGVGGLSYAVGQFKLGRTKKNEEEQKKKSEEITNQINVIKLLRDQIDALEKVVENTGRQCSEFKEDIKKLIQEVGRLQGVIESKDKQITELNNIIANRDPALTDYIKFGRETGLKAQALLEAIHTRLDVIEKNKDVPTA